MLLHVSVLTKPLSGACRWWFSQNRNM